MTAPVSAWSLNTRIAPSKASGSCSGRVHTVEETGHGAEGVVYRDVSLARVLELLKYGVRHPGSENIAREQQDWEPVDRRQRCSSDHVGGSRPDR